MTLTVSRLLRMSLVALSAVSLSHLSVPAVAQPSASSPVLPPGSDTQVIDNLSILPQIPIEQFPTVVLTTEVVEQFAAAGTPLPADAKLGQEIRPEDLFRIGNFEPFGLGDISLDKLAQQTGTSLNPLTMADLDAFFEQVTLEKLLYAEQRDQLAEMQVSEVPAVKAILVQLIADKLNQDNRLNLSPLWEVLRRQGGSLGELLREVRSGMPSVLNQQATVGNASKQGSLRLGDSFTGDLNSIDPALGKLTVEQLSKAVKPINDVNFGAIPSSVRQQIAVQDAVPGLTRLSIGNIEGVDTLPLSSLSKLKLPSLSLGQMPKPMKLSRGVQFGIADVALGEPAVGDHEQQRLRVISGGIRSKKKRLTGVRCPGNSCPHFEISTAGGGDYHGAAWMDGSTQVPDGFGLLCKPWGCKGPAGNHPFGSGVRVQLRNIDQAQGTAQVSLSFAYCRRILFVGKTCTPWVFPVPSGIPIGTIREQTIIPFAPPHQVKSGLKSRVKSGLKSGVK